MTPETEPPTEAEMDRQYLHHVREVCDGCAFCDPEKDEHCPRCCSLAHPF